MSTNRIAHQFAPYTPIGMARPRKPPRVALGTDIPPVLMDALRDYSDVSNLPINLIVEQALTEFLARHWHIGDPE